MPTVCYDGPYRLFFYSGGIPGFFMRRLRSVSTGGLSVMVMVFVGLTWMKIFQWKLSCLAFPPARAGNHGGTGSMNESIFDSHAR